MRLLSPLIFILNVFLGLFVASTVEARTDQDLRQLIQQRVQRLDGAINRCQQRINSGEIDDCTVYVDWQDATVSMDAAQTIAAELRAGLRSFAITTKSFIREIDTSSLSGEVRTRAERLFADFSNLNFSENPATPATDTDDYRLFSRMGVTVVCRQDEITNWQFGDLQTAFGSEFGILGAVGSVSEPIEASPGLGGDYSTASIDFSYKIIGRPNATTLPVFLAVHGRSCSWIWHKIQGTITCDNSRSSIDLSITGSQFPSHRAWINGQQRPTIYQGPFSDLWDCDPSDPQMVR
jgi:hypothetical protein